MEYDDQLMNRVSTNDEGHIASNGSEDRYIELETDDGNGMNSDNSHEVTVIERSDKVVIIDGESFWIPNVPDEIKPIPNGQYSSNEEIHKMYLKYANAAGFDIRKTTDRKLNGIVTLKYIVCNRQGIPNTSPLDTLVPEIGKITRRSNTSRCDCKAGIKFKVIKGSTKWVLYHFEEKHNHELISSHNSNFSRYNRQLDNRKKHFITAMSTQNIGATVAYRLYSGIQGGYNANGGLVNDFRNFSRDLNCFMKGTDAQMLVDKMNNRKNNVENFTFEYRVDDNSRQLDALFWADETAKVNYREFGDVVSFDATFRTNRYHMVFVPFTGIDNHKRSVTFGAGLLSREDSDSYAWLLDAFLKAFKKPPIIVVSDQDPAMKRAIANVFPNAYHRLCMWHITSKLPLKVSVDVLNNTSFRKRFNELIWNPKIEVDQFEQGWTVLMNEFNLSDNKWLKDMYGLRKLWIPAFFKYVQFSRLMRTTSRSESQNSAFNQNTHYGSTLVHFMMSFEVAMEKQRFNQSSLDYSSKVNRPKMLTPLDVEYNSSLFYTPKVFRQVQNEIYMGMFSCSQISQENCEYFNKILVKEIRDGASSSTTVTRHSDTDSDEEEIWTDTNNESLYEIKYNKYAETFNCNCMKFEQFGILCRHIFTVMKANNIKVIPPKYLLRRWKSGIIPTELLKRCFRYADSNENIERVSFEIFSSVDNVVSSLKNDQASLENYLKKIKEVETEFISDVPLLGKNDKTTYFEKRLGVTIPSVVEIENPAGIRNKGCGSRKRLKSAKEVSVEKAKKKAKCNYCKKGNDHDWRNCPNRREDLSNNIVRKHPVTKI